MLMLDITASATDESLGAAFCTEISIGLSPSATI
jgi:hypothetical protein